MRGRTLAALGLAALLAGAGGVAWVLFGPQHGVDASPGVRGNAASAGATSINASLRDPASSNAETERALGAERQELAHVDREADATPTAATPGSIALVGRTVDERRFPIAGTVVSLWFPDRPGATTKSDAAGRFAFTTKELTATGWLVGGIHARDGDGRAALKSVTLYRNLQDPTDAERSHRNDIGALLLRPGGELALFVHDAGGPVADAALQIEVGESQTRAIVATTDAAGRTLVQGVPAGEVTILASALGRAGRAATTIDAGSRRDLSILLTPTRTIDVQVTALPDGVPVAGAQVQVLEQVRSPSNGGNAPAMSWAQSRPLALPIPPTDANGRTRIRELEAGRELAMSARATGFVFADASPIGSWMPLPLHATSVELAVQRPEMSSVHWKLLPATAPPDGTVVRLLHARHRFDQEGTLPTPTEGQIQGGMLVVENVGSRNFSAWALAPDGRLADVVAELESPTDHPWELVVFGPARRLVVTVWDAAGRPGTGRLVHLRRKMESWSADEITSRTGADGTATIAPLLAEEWWVSVATDAGKHLHQLGPADLTDGNVQLEWKPELETSATLRVTVDGERRLPSEYTLWIDDELATERREDPATGEIHVTVSTTAPARQHSFTLRVPGFPDVEGTLPVTGTTSPTVVELALARGGTLVVQVRRPAGELIDLRLQRFDPANDEFVLAPGGAREIDQLSRGDARFVVTGLPPGQYRVTAPQLEVSSDVVEVEPGIEAQVSLDLSTLVWLAGRVEMPERESARQARVVVVDGVQPTDARFEYYGWRSPGSEVHDDGSFRIRLLLRAPVRLRAWHPVLQPAPEDGEVTVTSAQDDVVLRLVEAPCVKLHATFATPRGWHRFAARLIDPESPDSGRPLLIHDSDDELRFVPPPAGTYDLFIDPEEDAPVMLRGVVLEGGAQDLGEIEFPRGSRLRLTLDPADATRLTELSFWISHDGAPDYTRTASLDDHGVLVATGLGAGSFDVLLHDPRYIGSRKLLAVELDGEHDRELPLSLR